ncbi:unnamed protein product [Triticum turgidum subsp. durum]|uniref:F-box protein SKIP1 n=1 Tax=Triticum turgidum subsp. durum TaxID=4567 RepID=A0A9R0QQC7_TRITD|nr:unnamed protein product [Triticum turgidum subsp. durum]
MMSIITLLMVHSCLWSNKIVHGGNYLLGFDVSICMTNWSYLFAWIGCIILSLLIRSFICSSPQLSILSIQSSPGVTDRSMLTVASCCPILTELDISYCYEVSYKSLEVIGQNCPNLVVLKRSIFNWLDSSEHARTVPAEYLRACPQDGDREATAISRSMPKLKQLVLRFAKLSGVGLNSIAEGCKELEVLDLFGCANLTSRGIEQAAANLKNLETLVKPNFYIPRSAFHMERYGHWQLYDERFQTNVFQI